MNERIFKIKMKDGFFSTGGTWGSDSIGKSWDSLKSAKSAIKWRNGNYNDAEIIEYELVPVSKIRITQQTEVVPAPTGWDPQRVRTKVVATQYVGVSLDNETEVLDSDISTKHDNLPSEEFDIQ